MVTGADVPGTPSTRASPSYDTARALPASGVWTVIRAAVPVLSTSTVAVVRSAAGSRSPLSTANGTTAASMLPQLGVVSTVSPVGWSWAKRNSRSTPGRSLRETMPALLVSGCAPPRPSI